MPEMGAMWRAEIDAVEFYVDCEYRFVVHRNVFRTLRGTPSESDVCLAFVEANADAFLVAAHVRIKAAASPSIKAFHLNSRQLRRAMRDASERGVVLTEPAPR